MIVWLALALATPQTDSVRHEFVYQATEALERVNLAGSFNGWNRDAWPMKVDADGRTWRFAATLEPGKHYYKFVLNGDRWINDPKAKRNEDDGGGNVNSVLVILPQGYDQPARVGDGRITTSTLKHEQAAPYLNWDQGQLEIQLRCRPNDAERVELWVSGKLYRMAPVFQDDYYARYATKVPWDRKKDLDYLFAIWDKKAGANLGSGGVDRGAEVVPFRLSAKDYRPIEVPGWVERTVMYQIFPDRFANGDPGNDPANVVPWNAAPTFNNVFGGDFAGVLEHLGHLKSLGIGAIYFNPIFQSPINHRYETSDYFHVDRYLGTNEEFSEMTRKLKANGIRVVLDGVFNHCATDFPPFQDVRDKGEQSEYKDWFYIKSYPVEVKENPPYEAWFGFPSMPKVNLGNADAAAFMLGVPKYWNERAEIAGWRLDVANEVPMAYWREFRKTVKALRSDAWICGEVWTDGSPWLQGDQWDSVMNYPLRDALLRFVAEGSISASECLNRMKANYAAYVPQVSRNLMKLLSSHDTPRFLTLCKGDRKLAMLGATLQFGWAGCPSIYYGEELGMEGGRDPDNRRGTDWSLANDANPVLKHYSLLVDARRRSRALQSGEPVVLAYANQSQTVAFGRVYGDEVAIVAANRSDKTVTFDLNLKGRVPVSSPLRKQGFDDVLGGGGVRVSSKGSILLRLGPKSSALLLPARPRSAAPAMRGASRPVLASGRARRPQAIPIYRG